MGPEVSKAMTATDWISAIAAVTSAVVAIVAAFAAFRSARAAEQSAKGAAAIPRRALIRDVAATAEQVVDWIQATEMKAQQWKAQQMGYSNMMGIGTSPMAREIPDKIDARLAEIAALRDETVAISRDSPQLHAASDDDLSIKLGKLISALDKLHRIYDEATAEIASLSAKVEAASDRRQRELIARSESLRGR
jgi:hypothetical protein